MPKSAKYALELDKKNGNIYCSDAIAKEMKNVRVAFQILDDYKPFPIGYTFIPCRIIFGVKVENFHHVARLVA